MQILEIYSKNIQISNENNNDLPIKQGRFSIDGFLKMNITFEA